MIAEDDKPPTWERQRLPLTGMHLRKPKAITRSMLERWDICYEGVQWFDRIAVHGKRFPLDDEFIEEAFSTRVIEMSFKTVWFSWVAVRLFSDLSKQTKGNAGANRALNAKLQQYMAAVTAVSLRDYPQGILMIEQARLGQMFVRILGEL